MIGQRTQTARAVEADLRKVVRLQRQSALPEARVTLEQAQLRLGDDGPARLRSRLDRPGTTSSCWSGWRPSG